MIHPRSTRRLLCRLFAGVLLLSQWLVAAHACPVMAPASQHAMSMADGGPTACDAMAAPGESGPSNLCAGHCQAGQQSDQVPGASVAPALPVGAHPLPAPVLHAASGALAARDAPERAAAPPPPLAVLNCCFRL